MLNPGQKPLKDNIPLWQSVPPVPWFIWGSAAIQMNFMEPMDITSLITRWSGWQTGALCEDRICLFPHAFYYSIRGPRFDERPPDVGPNASWWNNYKSFADACRRLSWLNTDSKQVCSLAILCEADWLPDKSAKICYQHQYDFNYLEIRHLWEDSKIDETGIHISGMDYKVLIIDSLSFMPEKAIPYLKKLAENGRLIIRKNSPYSEMFKGAHLI